MLRYTPQHKAVVLGPSFLSSFSVGSGSKPEIMELWFVLLMSIDLNPRSLFDLDICIPLSAAVEECSRGWVIFIFFPSTWKIVIRMWNWRLSSLFIRKTTVKVITAFVVWRPYDLALKRFYFFQVLRATGTLQLRIRNWYLEMSLLLKQESVCRSKTVCRWHQVGWNCGCSRGQGQDPGWPG